jgi:hypothetical protein
MIWIALSILVLAAVLHYWLRRIKRVLEATGTVIERLANRAAAARGDEPVTTQEDVEYYKKHY